MKKSFFIITLLMFASLNVFASPEEDQERFRDYFEKRFPETEFSDYKNGVYSIDLSSREQWESIEDFPPYEINIEQGEELFNTPFKNGNTYASCFENSGEGIRQNYPFFDVDRGEVVTLELAINECRKNNGEKPYSYYKGGPMADISAYMASTSAGNIFEVKIPNDDRAFDAYEEGKRLYFTKVGQLNFSCADCHVYQTGSKLRADIPSPAIGHPTHFPVYRSSAGRLVTLHERFAGCLNRVRAKPFKAQGEEYRNLEYFISYMSNGLEINGPGSRK
tara:strand:- start:1655 stop:2485 length:831 start_codon:yes stop_codon:yes gene_type:complete